MREPRFGNPPPSMGRMRVLVKARPTLPRAFIWEIIQDDYKGNLLVLKRSPPGVSFATMDAAFTAGQSALKSAQKDASTS